MEFNILATRKIWYTLSVTFIVASLVAMAVYGFKFGIDFTGGSLLQVHYTVNRPDTATIVQQIKPLNVGDVVVQPTGDAGVIIKAQFLQNDQRQAMLQALGTDVVEDSFESIGPAVGEELRTKAVKAIIFVVLCIVVYIAWAFRGVSKGPVPSWAFGISAFIALLHDIIIPLGIFSALGHYIGVEINAMFITALLTILGFSIHDTIVVFDRIRENLRRSHQPTFAGIINESINNTMMRSLNTSTTVLLVLSAMLLFGGAATQYFILALMIGVIVGTYSSIFIASPLLLIWEKLLHRK